MNDYMGRVLADSRDEAAWHTARFPRIGASDAAGFAKVESVELYVRAKVKAQLDPFRGNQYTATGNRWEEPALAGAGFERNTYLFADADEDGFCATPDAVRETAGGLMLAEAKACLVKGRELDEFDPDTWQPKMPPTHQRQMLWAQMVLGAQVSAYVVLPYDERHTPLLMLPRVVLFPRDDERIAQLRAIGHQVLAAMRAAADFERNLP